ncbi:cytochrome o ubiquinol oxidase subunit III [Klebsiella pneumoniae]|uniref:Cytochrome o ubiquinol oxidase subunit III n=1 Tax=Klebsiella pneumoniae TaxID=573 RepID=A0A2X3CBI0_KLEPN|nr:cytochrome o ubiquinol oxidase subunit III [Klebsiella pneumoniae]
MNGTAGGPTGKDIFELPFVLVETALLLFSSITYGMAAIAMYKNNKSQVVSWCVDLVVWRRIYRDGNL